MAPLAARFPSIMSSRGFCSAGDSPRNITIRQSLSRRRTAGLQNILVAAHSYDADNRPLTPMTFENTLHPHRRYTPARAEKSSSLKRLPCFYFAYSTARVSRTTLTLICPG